MDEEQIELGIDETTGTSPASTAKRAKQRITYERVPMDTAIAATTQSSAVPAPTVTEPIAGAPSQEGDLVNTTRPAPKGPATIHQNNGFPDSATLVNSGGDSYIGGSVSPNSTVNATLRPKNQYGRDPFWLESTERFTPVEPWTAKLAILNEPVKASTYDVDKFANAVARSYLSVPEDDFFGYEYVPKKPFRESWYSSFVSDYAAATANVWANSRSALLGSVSDEEAAKTPEQRAEENRQSDGYWLYNSFGLMRRKAQEYLDYINQLEPIERGRGAQIAGAAGSTLATSTPTIAAGGTASPMAWLVGAGLSSVMSASETLGTRDAVLANGGTVGEAQRAQWKHMGAIAATELLTSMAGNYLSTRAIDAAIKRGASKAAAKWIGFGTEFLNEGVAGNTLEVYQDKIGNIIAGKSGLDTLFAPWTEEEWTNFYGGLVALGLGAGAGGMVRAESMYKQTSDALNQYMAVASKYKAEMVAKAKERGVELPESVLKGLDNLIMEVWNNPEGMFDEDIRHVSQGFFDSLKDLDPAIVAQAQDLITNTPEATQRYSQQAFADFDERVKSQPWYKTMPQEQQNVVLGVMRGMAYVGAFFYGMSPSEIKIPNYITETGGRGFYGVFHGPDYISTEALSRQSVADARLNELKGLMKGESIEERYNDIVNHINEAVKDPKNYVKHLNAAKSLLLEEPMPDGKRKLANGAGQTFDSASKLIDYAYGYLKEKQYYDNLLRASDVGTVGIVGINDLPSAGAGPYNDFLNGKVARVKGFEYNNNATQFSRLIENTLHEFSHANDWQMSTNTVKDFANFVKWYLSAIEKVFGKLNANEVKEAITGTSEAGVGHVNLAITKKQRDGAIKEYTDHANITEWRAQAIGSLMRQAAEYNGLMGNPAEFVQAVNAILTSANEQAPLSNGITSFVNALREVVANNSKVVDKYRKSVPAEKMHAAIAAYMGGDENINWYGITPATLKDFAESIDGALLNSEALNYAIDALGDIQIDDFVDAALTDWNKTFDIIEEKDPSLVKGKKKKAPEGLTDTQKTEIERETAIDGGIDPEEDSGIEDWSTPAVNGIYSLVEPATEDDVADQLKKMAEDARKKEPSEFQKNINKKFNGKTVEGSMEEFEKALDAHKFVKFGTTIDFMRGPFAFLSALGGKRLLDMFDLVNRYDAYSNRVTDFNDKMVDVVLPLFGGNRTKYEDYIRRAGVPMYEVDYKLPSGLVEKRLVSKRELMSGLLYNEQEDSKERIAMTVDDAQVRGYLDKLDVDFAHALRQYLYDDFRKVKKGKGAAKIPENYWPIMDSYAQERGDTQIVNDFGRKNTDAPIGLVDVLAVMGGYLSRRAGAESGYFAAMRRLNTILNYDKRKQSTYRMDNEDIKKNEELNAISDRIQQKIKRRLGTNGFERFRDNVADTIAHRNENDLKDSFISKMSRNALTGLINGNLKQISVNMAGIFSWLGYDHNSYVTFLPNLVWALLHPVQSWELSMQNDSFRNRRAWYRYNEVMHKNLSANSDNFTTYIADWATKHNVYSLEALSDLLIHVGQFTKKVFSSAVRESDAFMNAIGYAASYNAAVKALGSEEAAKASLANYMNTTQSTTNQATKSLTVRKMNRTGVWGSIFSFTSEPTQKFGSMSQAINRYLSGDMSFDQTSRVVTGQVLAMAAYWAVQSGVLFAALMPLFGGKMSDDDWDKIYDNMYREAVAAVAGLGGPLSNAVVQPFLNQIVFDYDYQGNNIPVLAETARLTKQIKKGDYTNALMLLMSLFGLANGAPKAFTTGRGFYRRLTANNQKEKNAGLWMAEGRTEANAERMSGIKKKRNKK